MSIFQAIIKRGAIKEKKMKTDIQIAQEATMLPIKEVTAKLG